MTTEDVLRQLRAAQLVDHDLLTPAERADVQQTLGQLAQRGLRAYVVLLPQSAELQTWRQLWTQLGLREPQALLFLYNGRRWEARGWGLAADVIAASLTHTEPTLRQHQGAGLRTALTLLAAQAAPQPRRTPARPGTTTLWPWVGGGALVLLIGAAGWFLYRRQRLQQQQVQVLQARCADAEAAFTEIGL